MVVCLSRNWRELEVRTDGFAKSAHSSLWPASKFFEILRAGTAPSTFTRQFLKDLNFKSSNHLHFIPLLKGLGFLTSDGTPTERYKQFLDVTRWKQVLAEAVRESYSDIFVIKAKPTNSDLQTISGKFKSTYNYSDTQADRAARTFLALLNLSDPETLYGPDKPPNSAEQIEPAETIPPTPAVLQVNGTSVASNQVKPAVGLHYNIQIHLPATKDIEVYNNIFKSLRADPQSC
jgi:Family of unknown function (DUF5343)